MTCSDWNDRGPRLSVFVFLYATLVIGTNGIWKLGLTHTYRHGWHMQHTLHTHSFNDEWKPTDEEAAARSLTLTCWGMYEQGMCVWVGGLCVCVCVCVSNWSVYVTRRRESGAASSGVRKSIGVLPLFSEKREKISAKSLVTTTAWSLPWQLTKMKFSSSPPYCLCSFCSS